MSGSFHTLRLFCSGILHPIKIFTHTFHMITSIINYKISFQTYFYSKMSSEKKIIHESIDYIGFGLFALEL